MSQSKSGPARKRGKPLDALDRAMRSSDPFAILDALGHDMGSGTGSKSGPARKRGRSHATLRLLAAAQEILAEIQPASVRATCYRLFVAHLIPDMSKNSTNRVSEILTRAREEGDIPWEWIVDETRSAEQATVWTDPEERFDHALRNYRKDRWQDQPNRVEVMSEKGTVRGTLAPVLEEYAVPFRVMHGYGSATVVNDIAEASQDDERPFIVLYVGDHDPSGMHMSEVDLPERLERYGGAVEIQRVAHTRADTPGLPGFPLADKTSDSRARWYGKRYGRKCWELDALPPPELRAKVKAAIRKLIDRAAWDHAGRIEAVERESMKQFLGGWPGSKSGPARK